MTAAFSRLPRVPLLLCLCAIGAAASPAHAEARTGETVVVAAGEIVYENLYASGGTVAIRGTVHGDLIVAGGNVVIDGQVLGDVLAAGGQVTLSGAVVGDVRAAGGQVSLLAPVGGEAVIAAGDAHLAAPVSGDVMLTGGSAVVTAPVEGALYSTAGETTVGAAVGGDVVARGGRLLLEDGARIRGDVRFTGPGSIERERGSSVAGTVLQRRAEVSESGAFALLYGWLQLFMGLFLLGLVFALVFRGFLRRSLETLRIHPGLSVVAGAAALLGVPLIIGLVFFLGAFVGGAWLGLFGLAVYGIALTLCFPLIAASLGLVVVQRFRSGATAEWWPMLLGLVVLSALLFVPLLGPLVALVTVLFGLGAIVLTLIPTLRFTSTPTAETAPLPSTSASMSSRI